MATSSLLKSVPVLVVLGGVVAVPSACGGKATLSVNQPTPDAGPQYYDPNANQPPPPASDAGPVAVAEAGAPVVNPEAGAPPAADAGAPAIAVEAVDGAIDLAIKAQAVKDAPGMAAEGQPGRETLQEGAHFNMLVTLQPNRCYTMFAYSPIGNVSQIEMKLLAPPFYNVEAGHSAPTDKNAAVIGKGKSAQCPILPVPIVYKIDVTAKKGAGRIGVYLYARNK